MRRLLLALLVLPALHCGSQEPDPTPSALPAAAPDPAQPDVVPPAPAQAEAAPDDQAPSADEPGALPDPGTPADNAVPGTPHAEVDPNAAGLAEVRETGEAIEAALNAAAEQGGDTICERGYNNLVAMVRELRTRVGTSGQRNPPERGPFLEACNELPPEIQECLVLSYALGHRQECEIRKNSLDPAVRAHIRVLMSGEE